jgi:hypothetical protein
LQYSSVCECHSGLFIMYLGLRFIHVNWGHHILGKA